MFLYFIKLHYTNVLVVYTEAVVKRSFIKVYPQDLTINVGDVIKDVIKVWTHPFCPSIHYVNILFKDHL